MEEYILSAMNNQVNVIKPIIDQMNRVIEARNDIYLEGANKVFDFPEFKKIEGIAPGEYRKMWEM